MVVAVIGGGAAGVMAAYSAASFGADVILFEKNEKLGKKMYISGKGRCNVTNNSAIEQHISNVVTNPKFLFAAYNAFSPTDLMQLIESEKIPLKTERGDRVFPISDKSSDIIFAFEKLLKKNNVKVYFNSEVEKVEKVDNQFLIFIGTKSVSVDKVIIATGGFTYQATGSTGDGYKFAKSFGLNVTPLYPALVGLKLKDPLDTPGLALKNVTASITVSGKTYEEFGEMLFTHTGVSGPIILTLSSYVNKSNINGAKLMIDLKPALNIETLDNRLVREISSQPNKQLKSIMPNILPSSLIVPVLVSAGLTGREICNSITKTQRLSLLSVLKNLTFTIDRFEDFNGAIITSGGVEVKELDPKTMMSKNVSGLYFAGEVIDVDALTGGYNLQIAFSTGYLAGKSAAMI